MVRQVLLETGSFHVIDISRGDNVFKSTYVFDLSNLSLLEEVLNTEAPDVVINCVGVLTENAELNPEKSIFVNSFIPHFLANRCKRLIHISTDCVFSGKKGDYIESDFKDGEGFYAESKSLGEVLYSPHLTLRTSIIGPEINPSGRGLLHWFLNQNTAINGYTKAYWSGVTTLQLARGILEFIDRPELTGLIHFTNNTKISKFELLKLINSIFNKSISINPYENYQVDKSLINTRNDIILDIPDYETMIGDLFNRMSQHKSGYPYSF
jgi:dTDP-4-dehydrorhamnose reductase